MLKERLRQFMYGRYGNDNLNRFITIASLVSMVLGMFTHSNFLYWCGFALLVWCYFRMLSRNIAKRSHENALFYQLEYQVKEKFHQGKNRFAQRKDFCFFRCPQCGQMVRVPKGRGKIEITCPKCSNHFVKKS